MTWQDLIGAQIAGRYTLRTLLYGGKRHSEFVAAASDAEEKPVSITLVEPDAGEAAEELEAIHRAQLLRHANLLGILDAGEYVVEGVRMLYIATERVETTMAQALTAGTAPSLTTLLEDILAGLEWLHEQGLVYRNLEPDTIVRADRRWKLADLSQVHQVGEFGPIQLSGRTVPPEASTGSILPAWDVWALGVLVQDLAASQGGALPARFDEIVDGCLQLDPKQRLSLTDVRKLVRPTMPLPVPKLAPLYEVKFGEPAAEQERRFNPRIAAIVVALIVVAVGIAFLRRDRQATPSANAQPVVTKAAPATAPPAAPAPAPAKAPPPVAAPTPVPSKPKPAASAENIGRADYFSDDLDGHPTASGEKFSNKGMTAAHRKFPIGTRLRVTNLENGRHAVVRVNDRGPHRPGFIISVSRHAAEQLGFAKAGSARVKLEVVK